MPKFKNKGIWFYKSNRGQATLEFFLIVAFVTVSLVIITKFFFPAILVNFEIIGNLVELSVESGQKFK